MDSLSMKKCIYITLSVKNITQFFSKALKYLKNYTLYKHNKSFLLQSVMTFQWDVFMFITAHIDEPNVIMMI